MLIPRIDQCHCVRSPIGEADRIIDNQVCHEGEATYLCDRRWRSSSLARSDPQPMRQQVEVRRRVAHCLRDSSTEPDSASLAYVRQNAAAFLESLQLVDLQGSNRDRWLNTWLAVGERHRLSLGDPGGAMPTSKTSVEPWLCALTAFQVAKRLANGDDARNEDISARIAACAHEFELRHVRPLERIELDSLDEVRLTGIFLPGSGSGPRVPVVICISDETESESAMLSRILPALIGRGISVLVVGGENISWNRTFNAEILLRCWLDYLASRSDVDVSRIAVFGDGTAAAHASSLAATDQRVAAAVCDGGLWRSVRTHAAVRWLTSARDAEDIEDLSIYRSSLAFRTRCPVLIVAGARGFVREHEALALHDCCRRSGLDVSVVMPRSVPALSGQIDNFLTCDDFIFDWLESKLYSKSALNSVTRL